MMYFIHLFIHLYITFLINARKMKYILNYYSPSKIQIIYKGSHTLQYI